MANSKKQWKVVVREAGKKSGTKDVDFEFLDAWQGQVDESALRLALERFAARYSTAVHVTNGKHVLRLWVTEGPTRGWTVPARTSDARATALQLTDLRRTLFHRCAERGMLLTSINALWRSFISLLEEFVATGVLPSVDTRAHGIRPVPASLTQIHRERAISLSAGERSRPVVPRSFAPERDSYNDDLLEAMSITAADTAYLDEYEARLGAALDTIRRCAVEDFEALVSKRAYGQEQLGQVETLKLAEVAEGRRRARCSGQAHPFAVVSGHPNMIGNLLWLVDHYMDGLPKSYESRAQGRDAGPQGPFCWTYVRDYGKNRLLPYLGVLSSSAAAVCFVILLVEHPQLNPSSLARARLSDASGRPILLLDAGQDEEALRLVTKKPRAGSEKSVLLSPLARRVVEHVLEWTRVVRSEMTRQGRMDEASRLWVGMNSLNYEVIALSERSIYSAFRLPAAKKDWGAKSRATRSVPFLSRHPELERWASRATFKSIRVSVGVLQYLKTGGDLVATAEAFGHKSVRTTLGHYVPPALRNAIFERQIRRHQNLLIATSAGSERDAVGSGDFRSVEELHTFLRSLLPSSEDGNENVEALRKAHAGGDPDVRRGKGAADDMSSEVALVQDPRGIAIAILYREHLRPATAAALARKDMATRIAPQFWIDFVECITGPLPNGMHEIGQLVRQAQALAPTMRAAVRFPPLVA